MTKLEKEIDQLEDLILKVQNKITTIQMNNKLSNKDFNILERAYKKISDAYNIIHAKIWN
jgi:polyribonucleotide nucleotidyltransferase